MSAWGLSDNTTIAGTVTGYAQNTRILGSTTYFTSNLNAGDYLTISTIGKYQIDTITSDTVLTLTSIPTAAVSGKKAFVQQGPKSVLTSNTYPVARQSNVLSIQNMYGVDINEILTTNPGSVTISSAGTGYQRLANATAITANTTGVFYTTGGSLATSNATATLTFSSNVLSAITVTSTGNGYLPNVVANTTFVIATTGASQPTTNATGTISFTSSNASHSGWVQFVTYSDANGLRRKSEVLVALSKNGISGDDEDTRFPE